MTSQGLSNVNKFENKGTVESQLVQNEVENIEKSEMCSKSSEELANNCVLQAIINLLKQVKNSWIVQTGRQNFQESKICSKASEELANGDRLKAIEKLSKLN